MPIMYVSHDNGEIHAEVDDPSSESFYKLEVNDTISLTPEECCVPDGSIVEALLSSGQAKVVA